MNKLDHLQVVSLPLETTSNRCKMNSPRLGSREIERDVPDTGSDVEENYTLDTRTYYSEAPHARLHSYIAEMCVPHTSLLGCGQPTFDSYASMQSNEIESTYDPYARPMKSNEVREYDPSYKRPMKSNEWREYEPSYERPMKSSEWREYDPHARPMKSNEWRECDPHARPMKSNEAHEEQEREYRRPSTTHM